MNLDEGRKLLANATRGPWEAKQSLEDKILADVEGPTQSVADDLWWEDAALIVWLRNNADALLESGARLNLETDLRQQAEAERDRLVLDRDVWEQRAREALKNGLERLGECERLAADLEATKRVVTHLGKERALLAARVEKLEEIADFLRHEKPVPSSYHTAACLEGGYHCTCGGYWRWRHAEENRLGRLLAALDQPATEEGT